MDFIVGWSIFGLACAFMIFMGFREKRRYLRDEELKRQHGHSD